MQSNRTHIPSPPSWPIEKLKLQKKLQNKRYRERKALPTMVKKRQNRIKYEQESTRYGQLTEVRKMVSQKRRARTEWNLSATYRKDDNN